LVLCQLLGEEKVFLIGSSEVSKKIRVRATCVWAKASGRDGHRREAGFKIAHVSDQDLKEIRWLIGFLTLGDRDVSRKQLA